MVVYFVDVVGQQVRSLLDPTNLSPFRGMHTFQVLFLRVGMTQSGLEFFNPNPVEISATKPGTAFTSPAITG